MSTETWQVMIEGQVYDADTETLKSWAIDGYVQPTDLVKKANLNWLEAQKIPMLRDIFLGAAAAPPVAYPSSGAHPAHASGTHSTGAQAYQSGAGYAAPQYGSGGHAAASGHQLPAYGQVAQASLPTGCRNHPQVSPYYLCRSCASPLCQKCVKMVGNVAMCGVCGQLCGLFSEVKRQTAKLSDKYSGIGFGDFIDAVKFPFQHAVSFFVMMFFYSLLSFGATFIRLGGGLLIRALAFAVLFGCISKVIRNMSEGEREKNIVPEINDPWEDVFHRCLLGIGVFLISWGPLVAVILSFLGNMLSMLMSGPENMIDNFREEAGTALVLGIVAMVWGIFYSPMALLIAGYTHNFGAVVNPLVGFDTMRRMGGVYAVAFGFYIVLTVAEIMVGIGTRMTLGPFGALLDDAVGFYFSIVLAYVLGLAVFKKSDELGLE